MKRLLLLSTVLLLIAGLNANAQTGPLPGSADAGRVVKQDMPFSQFDRDGDQHVTIPRSMPSVKVPQGVENINFFLRDVRVEGATAFSEEELSKIYSSYLNRNITLDVVWIIAEAITKHYQDNGYFLSRAYVPAQELENGIVIIRVVEGYVGRIDFEGTYAGNEWIANRANNVIQEKPIKAETLENFLLSLNSLPGGNFQAVLAPLDKDIEGAVKITLVSTDKAADARINFDNYGSRYLGPYQATLSFSGSIIPLQQTSVSLLGATQQRELKSITIAHEIPMTLNFSLLAEGSYTKANPGFTLLPLEIQSLSSTFGAGMKYQYIRQRQENLSFSLKLDGRKTATDILDTPLVRDWTRTLRLNAAYDTYDRWQGYNVVNVTFSQGLSILDASKKGDLNISRREATPDFQKIEAMLAHLHPLNEEWNVLTSLTMQVASGPLYSSEELGYGGQSFGRAYDPSEITGDDGLAGAVELRYTGLPPLMEIVATPYLFYDIGKVWNLDEGSGNGESASSAGAGVRLDGFGLSANFGIAQPLTRPVGAPLYGNPLNPRYLVGLSYNF